MPVRTDLGMPDWARSPYPEKQWEFRATTVVKRYPREIRHRLRNEIAAYRAVPWAAPKLLWATHDAICMQRLRPVIGYPPQIAHARQLRALLLRLHEAGWNHRDVAVSNVVVHPRRGVLLIDWETSGPVDPARPSYDLHGAWAAGVPLGDIPRHQRPDGVWWGYDGPHAPATFWKN